MNKYQEALDYLRRIGGDGYYKKQREKSFDVLQELVDKATPMKPIGDLDSVPHYRCPSCFSTVKLFDYSQCDKYCQECGQRIDWSKV